MATGYKLPNGTKSTSGFDFTGKTEWSYFPSGGPFFIYVMAITGHGYIRAYNSGDATTSYPAAQYGQKSGPVYVRNGDRVDYAGDITTDNYTNITKSKTVVAYSSSATGGSIGGASQVWESDGGANVTAEPASGFLVTAFSGYSGSLPSNTTVTQRIPYSGSASVAATFTQYYDIKFDKNGGVGAPEKMSQCLWNQYYSLPTGGSSRTGYKLTGWNTNANGTGTHYNLGEQVRNLTTTSGGTVTLYAEWTRYGVTYTSETSTSNLAVDYCTPGESVTLRDYDSTWPVKTGHHFGGWTIGQTRYNAGTTYEPSGNVNAVAYWTPNTYNLAFNTNGGSGQVGSMAGLLYGTSYSLPTYAGSKSYHTFVGWARTADATVPEFQPNATVQNVTAENNRTVTLYAVWQRNKRTVQLTNTNTEASVTSVRCEEDPSFSATDVSGVLEFEAIEGYTYYFVTTYRSVYLSRKFTFNGWVNPNSETLMATKVSETVRELRYLCTASSATRFTTSYTEQAQYNIVVNVLGRIGSVPFVGAKPTARIVNEKDSEEGWFGQDVTIAYDMQGNEDMEFDSWTAKAGGVPYATYDPASLQPMTFFLRGDTTVEVNFRVKTAQVAADVHVASAAVVGSTHASVEVDQYTTGQNSHGDLATFTADSLGSGHAFAGWFLADGTPAPDSFVDGAAYTSASRVYRKVITGDLHLYAKYCSRVEVYFKAPTGPGGEPLASGMVYANGVGHASHVEQDVTIGATCEIAVTTNDFFQGWYLGANPNFITDIPLQYDQNDSFVVADGVTMSAYVVAEQSYNYVALYNYDQREGHEEYAPSLGTWRLNDGAQQVLGVEPMTKSGYESAMSSALGRDFHAPADGVFYRVAGVRRLTFEAIAAGALGVADVKRYAADDMTTPLQVFQTARVTCVVNDYFAFVAEFGEAAPRTVSVRYANGSQATEGDIDLYEEATGIHAPQASDGSRTAIYTQGTIVVMSAIPRNGYRFVGWYYDADHVNLASPAMQYRLAVPYSLTLYAVFAQDPNAIYEWEGSDAVKTMRWKSKMFVASKPFNPVVARVDALGYPVKLTVGVFSAPQGGAVRKSEIHPASSAPRRLGLLRPERHVQVTIEAAHEVDKIVVGTSMEGINV